MSVATEPARWLDAVGRLVTDAALRGRFHRDPTVLDVDPADLPRLAAMRDELERFARGLLDKRKRDFAAVVPWSARVAPSLPDRYAAWLATRPAPVVDSPLGPGLSEALRALPALSAALREDDEVVYAADLLVFEVLRACGRVDGVARTATLRYPVPTWTDDLARGLLPVDPDAAPTVIRCGVDVRWRPA